MSTPTAEHLSQLEGKLAERRAFIESWLANIQETRGQNAELTIGEQAKYRAMTTDLRELDEQTVEYRSEVQRATIPEKFQNLGRGTGRPPAGAGRMNCRPGSEVMPINFGQEELRAAHGKVLRQEPVLMETRASNTASPLLPAQLFPIPTFPIHEGRIADRLPAFALDAPSLEYIQVNSVTGAAGITAEGAAKPEIVLNTTKIIATAVKIAAHLGLTWESVQDFDAFTSSANTELQRLIIDAENAEILTWLNTTGILTHAAVAAPVSPATTFDDLEQAIGALRVGPSLAVADLLILNPATWSSIRRQKDLQGRYHSTDDPASGEISSAWGVPVLETTACPDGEGWLLDTTKFGRLAVRESLAVRMGYSGTDFVQNVIRYVCEERCVLTVERPSAVLHITAMPVGTTTETERTSSRSSTAKK